MGGCRSAGWEVRELREGWAVAGTEPGACRDATRLDGLDWAPAVVPGTVGTAASDERDWWFRTRFDAEPAGPSEDLVLALDGLATVAEVYLDGERLVVSDSMYRRHTLDLSGRLVGGGHELAICCRALAPLLAARRRPRARWRTRIVREGNLRFFRTMLLGRAPGFAPGPPAIGPWAPVRLERRRGAILDGVMLRPRVDGDEGRLAVSGRLRAPAGGEAPTSAVLEITGHGCSARVPLAASRDGGGFRGELSVPNVRLWWPHTHGDPDLYDVSITTQEQRFDLGRVGFRALRHADDLERDGIQIVVNGVAVFVRGAVWTPVDLARPYSTGQALTDALSRVVEGGMNMLRVPGTGCYESEDFYDRCDELGILVWQDFMFANLDYPEQDGPFMASVAEEVRDVLARLGARPSLTVVCGGSEVAQQVAMMGLDPALASGPLFGELLPRLVREADVDATYVPSAPWGGALPFRSDRGVANYFGVGGYRRPLADVRRAEVRFASECLAFANVPDDGALATVGRAVHDPRWKAGVPRDTGAGWDFDDVRDHYLQAVFGVRPLELRAVDPDRYLELSRAVTGEMMAEVLGEWRRPGSPCGGALILWLRDLAPGAGWGLLDHRGPPKAAYFHVARALAPVAVWSTDEGLGGIDIHVANDRPDSLAGRLRISLYRDLETLVAEHLEPLALGPHASLTTNLEALLGRFIDAAWAYRFGPPAQDLIVMSLEDEGSDAVRVLSQSIRLPAGRPLRPETAARLGVAVSAGRSSLRIRAQRFLYGVRLAVPGLEPADDAFSVEPGRERVVELTARDGGAKAAAGALTAINLSGRVTFALEGVQ